MLQEIIELAWIQAFEPVLRRCALRPGDTVAVLCESPEPPGSAGAGAAGRSPDRLHLALDGVTVVERGRVLA